MNLKEGEKIVFEFFDIAKIDNPKKIIGGNGEDDKTGTATTQQTGPDGPFGKP